MSAVDCNTASAVQMEGLQTKKIKLLRVGLLLPKIEMRRDRLSTGDSNFYSEESRLSRSEDITQVNIRYM